jgi:hypothetical protein
VSLNVLDRARREIFAALLMEYHRSQGSLADYADLAERYHLKEPESLFDPVVSEIEHNLIFNRTWNGLSVRIKSSGYSDIFRKVLDNLGATELTIDWKKEEVFSDADGPDWFPVPVGWKWFQLKPDQSNLNLEIPAADRIVPLDHNSSEYEQISTQITDLAETLRRNNEVGDSAEHRDQLLKSMSAAAELWSALQLTVDQIKIGIILAIENAKAALTKVGKSVGISLIVDAIKAYVKSKIGLDI